MKNITKLSRAQFGHLQTARGLSADVIIQRTGILPQSLMVLLGAGNNEGLDAKKLISQATLERVLNLIGVDPVLFTIRCGGVIEWRSPEGKDRKKWKESIKALLPLFSTETDMTALICPCGMFEKKELIIYLYDRRNNIRVAITNADKKIKSFLELIFAVKVLRTDYAASAADFSLTKKLISNGVYRQVQFDQAFHGKKARYTWEHVKASAQEFEYDTEDLINLIVAAAQNASKAKQEVTTTETGHLRAVVK